MADEAQNALLQKIAAAAVPHMLGLVYSRYGRPSPQLGRDRFAVSEAGRSPAALGASGRPGSSQQDDLDERLQRYAELPDPEDEAAARAEQAGDGDYDQSLGRLQDYGRSLGVGTGELEDMKDAAPDLTEQEAEQYLADKSKGSKMTWEDWLARRAADTGQGE